MSVDLRNRYNIIQVVLLCYEETRNHHFVRPLGSVLGFIEVPRVPLES